MNLLVGLVFSSCALLALGRPTRARSETPPDGPFMRPDIKASQVLRAKGYETEEHLVIVDDGYVIALTRATNPLIGRALKDSLKLDPVLFTHGTPGDTVSYLVNSHLARARNLLKQVPDVGARRPVDLAELLRDEPSIQSLPLLLMNFGYEVWLMHRRGTLQSRQRIELPWEPPMSPFDKLQRAHQLFELRSGQRLAAQAERAATRSDEDEGEQVGADKLTERIDALLDGVRGDTAPSFNANLHSKHRITSQGPEMLAQALRATPAALANDGKLVKEIAASLDQRLWNHSLDEQAAWDVPRAVDYVIKLAKNKRNKCVFVADSAGAGLGLMALVVSPEMNEQISKMVLLAPAFNIGHSRPEPERRKWAKVRGYIGPFPATFISEPARALLSVLCALDFTHKTICAWLIDSSSGPSAGQTPITSELFSDGMSPTSAMEVAHLLQTISNRETRMYNFGAKRNALHYGGLRVPPLYDLRLITNEHISIWSSRHDKTVTLEDTETLNKHLQVAHKYFYFDHPNATVNHASFKFHQQLGRLVNVQVLSDISSVQFGAA